MVELVELGLAVLAAEAHLVAAFDPGELIGEVPGDVVAALGRSCADEVEAADLDVGGVGIAGAGDEAEALDVVSGVVVVEDLVEVVDAGEDLVGDVAAEDAVVDDGDVLHMDGSDLVVAEQVIPGDGSDLIALADEPVDGEVVLIGEAPVDLAEAVPAVAELGIVGVEVADGAGGIGREDVAAVQGVEGALHDGLLGDVVSGEESGGLTLPADGGLCGVAGLPDDEALVLKGEEAEEAVPDEWTADGEACVVVSDLLLGGGEGTLCAEELVAIEVVGGSVEGVGAGAEGEVDGSAGIATAFGAGLSLCGELVDGIEREDDSGDAGDATLIDCGDVVPKVVVVDAVDLPVHLVGSCAVEGAVASTGVSGVSGGELNHLGEVTAVEGEIGDGLCVEDGGLGDGGGVEGDGGRVDLDGLGVAGDGEFDGEGVDLTGGDGDVVYLGCCEAGGGDGDGVGAELEVVEEKLPC